jgi:multidrug efflux pump subunit AcrA (membrane-fusion protein)
MGRLGRVVAPGGAGGLVIKSALAGVISQVLVPNGEPVEPGTPLLRLGGTEHLWIRSRFVARPASELALAQPAGVRLPSGERHDLSAGNARFLSTLPVIDPSSRIATWVVDVAPHSQGNEARSDLRVGSTAVLAVRIGTPRMVLAVPTTAVIDINTRPFVFVQVDGESFDKRAVTLGDRDGPYVHVMSGIKKGERIVTTGGFDVHLASLMGEVQSHRH